MDERRWITAILAGDMQSFSCLVAKYEKMAYTIAVRIVENREDAEEVVQDAFLKMYQALPDFRFDSKFSSWFYLSLLRFLRWHRENGKPKSPELRKYTQIRQPQTAQKKPHKAQKKARRPMPPPRFLNLLSPFHQLPPLVPYQVFGLFKLHCLGLSALRYGDHIVAADFGKLYSLFHIRKPNFVFCGMGGRRLRL